MQTRSHAKINLFLHIVGRRANGYHEINSLMVFLDSLYDEITITVTESEPEVIFENIYVESENTVSKALSLLKERGLKDNFRVHIKKNIPLASGMGGGSGNAAIVLNYIASLYNIDDKTVADIAAKIGMDVVVCLKSKASMVSGTGEIVDVLKIPPKAYVVIVNNGKSLSTPSIYKSYRESNRPFSERVDIDTISDDLLSGMTCLKNDLQPHTLLFNPELEEVLCKIREKKGCAFSRVSGSGPTCFGVFTNAEDAYSAEQELQSDYKSYLVTSGRIF